MIFAAIGKDDTQKEAESMASKVLKVKLWDGEDGKKWKSNVQDIEGDVLCGAFPPSASFSLHFPPLRLRSWRIRPSRCRTMIPFSSQPHLSPSSPIPPTNLLPPLPVSQFTLLASTKKGNKPDFHKSAPPAKGKELYDSFIGQVRALYRAERVKDGVFGAMMDVGLVNDGPVGVDFRCVDEAVQALPGSLLDGRMS